KVAGDLQAGTVAQALDSELVVQVNDGQGRPYRGAVVIFAVPQGGGSVETIIPPTGENGQVRTQWTLGTAAGTAHQVTATLGGVGAVTFAATALPGAPVVMVSVAGDSQSGAVNAPLAEPLVVRLDDQYGNIVPGRRVDFSIMSGGGSLVPTSDTTGVDGRAQTSWTLGGAPGGQTAQAVVAGIVPVTFNATAASVLRCQVPGAGCQGPGQP
ncbi:MAG: hypothetical protein ACREMV_02180, partial [Gemmatimonadales bacterium]